MTPLTTVSELQHRLGWQDVTEYAPMPGWRVFAAWPSRKFLPPVEFLFDDQVSILQHLRFGPWHGHYQEWDDERRNVRRAIATARTLVTGARCLLVQRSAAGGYLGSSVYRQPELPHTLSKGFARLERLIFNTPPEAVAVDLARFHHAKDGSYIEHGWRRRLKEVYAGTPLAKTFD
jgi:hypothetical protein